MGGVNIYKYSVDVLYGGLQKGALERQNACKIIGECHRSSRIEHLHTPEKVESSGDQLQGHRITLLEVILY